MSITVDWYNAEKTALLYTYEGSWTWDDYDRVVGEGNTMMQSVSYTVHVVVHLDNTVMVPTDVISLKNRQRISNLTPPNHGKIIVYGLNATIYLMISTVRRLAPQWMASRNAIFVDSREEVDSALRSLDRAVS